MTEAYDIVVVGAGPAGMRAACTASALGCRVLVVDENPAPGGQIYRAIGTTPVRERRILGADYWRGAKLAEAFGRAKITTMAGASVWSIGTPGNGTVEVCISAKGTTSLVQARHVILATGAIERPFPVPGWTLPGVMTAGAAQIALKTSGLVPRGRVVIAGCGPLFYLLAGQLRLAGADIAAVLDTTPRTTWLPAAAALPGFLASPYALKGTALLLRAGRVAAGVTGLRVEGDGRAERVVAQRGRRRESFACDMVLLHHGVIPNTSISNALGCAHRFDAEQHCWVPEVDAWFVSSLPHVSIAGDGAGIGGSETSALRGDIAALAAACRLGAIGAEARDRQASPLRRRLARSMRGRRFLDRLYRPAPAFLAPVDPETIVCRCEEVTSGQVRATTRALDVTGPNQLKAFLRCGMGPCQGRMCATTITELMAETRGVKVADIGTYRLRPPYRPVTVGELARLPQTEAAVRAVVR